MNRENFYILRRDLQSQHLRQIVEAMQKAEQGKGNYNDPREIIGQIIRKLDDLFFDF